MISIVIPVYKVQDYLDKCVQSVLNQEFTDLEVILVNDGSPDRCPEICDYYASIDSRVKVIHKKNGGLSEARNFGIKAAKGDYLLFLDSDDYWETAKSLNNLVETIKMNEADVILYGTKDVNLSAGTTVVTRGFYDVIAIRKNRESAIKSLIETNQFPGAAWIVGVKREFLLENDIFFTTGIKAEDIDWLMHVFYKAKTFDAITDSFYMYIKNRPGSITNTSDYNSAKDVLYSVSKWKKILEDEPSETNNYLLSYLSYQYITAYLIYSSISSKEKAFLYPKLEAEMQILKYSKGLKSQVCKFVIIIFGISLGSHFIKYGYRFVSFFYKIKRIIG